MNTAQKTSTKFVLVSWLCDKTVGVIPLSGTADIDDEEEQGADSRCPILYSEGSRSKGNIIT